MYLIIFICAIILALALTFLFSPADNLYVNYAGITLHSCQFMTKDQTAEQPILSWDSHPDKLYTIIMSDPDAPGGTYLHWLIINIANPVFIPVTPPLYSYVGPTPPSGIHRYFIRVYEQNAPIFTQRMQEYDNRRRENFPVESFVKKFSLKLIGEKCMRVSA